MRTRRFPSLAVLLAGMAACAAGPTATLRATGVGAVAFGSSLAETELLVGEKATAAAGGEACRYVEFGRLPGLRFTVADGVVTRADAAPGVPNQLGVQLGDTVDSVVALYPDVDVQRIPGSFGETELVFLAPGGSHALVLHAAGNKIIGIRAGLAGAVGSAQGCP